jgi:hypothetical protein
MKSNAFNSILLGVLAISALFSLVLCGLTIKNIREQRNLQGIVSNINFREAGVRQLIGEVAEYSTKTKDNKEILQILESAGIRATLARTNAPTPATGAPK